MNCLLRWVIPGVICVLGSSAWGAAGESLSPTYGGSTQTSGAITTMPGAETAFVGHASHRDMEVVRYEWDFDGDGVVDFTSSSTGITQHIFYDTGTYHARFRAFAEDGTLLPEATVVVTVDGAASQVFVESSAHIGRAALGASSAVEGPSADGTVKHYALIINGGREQRFWKDMEYLYAMLQQYGYSDSDIYLLNYDGVNPAGENPNAMIDAPATSEALSQAITDLAAIVDGDDILHVFVDDHGNGYTGPVQYSASQEVAYGYNGGVISVDPGDEVDYIERDLKLRSMVVYGDHYSRTGMNQWGVYELRSSNRIYRHKYVSTISNVFFDKRGATVNDNDEGIERIVDYLKGDTNRDGVIDEGEVYDYDDDGVPPYNASTGTFDEDDWGLIDDYADDYNFTIPMGRAPEDCLYRKTLDINLDNTIDFLCSSDNQNFVVVATDADNDGLYDNFDINMDGDLDDEVSIDETFNMYGSIVTDDEFAALLAQIGAGHITVIMEQCNSGGFIDDLSGPNRVIFTAAEAETVSWGNMFIRNMISAFSGINYPGATQVDPAQADTNGNGEIDFAEAFVFASENDTYNEVPQYDDNGDAIPSVAIPNGSEGSLGATLNLRQEGNCEEFTASNSAHESAGRAYSETVTEGETCYGSFCFGGTDTTTWYAVGSNESLGTNGSTQNTLNTFGGSHFKMGQCPVPDTTAPVITLQGDNPMTVVEGSVFNDPGATAQDDIDGDITSRIVVSGEVNTSVLGTYQVTYSVTDEAGNSAEISRTVNVVEAPACEEFTATVSNHESASRAYSETTTVGETCYGTFCFGGTQVTNWYVQGSDESLGSDADSVVTLKAQGGGYAIGECPVGAVSPVIDSYTLTQLNHDEAEITGVASDRNGDLDRVVLIYYTETSSANFVGVNLDNTQYLDCVGTANFTCSVDFVNFPLPVGEEVGLVLVAYDKAEHADSVVVPITRPEPDQPQAPVVVSVESSVNGFDITITTNIVDANDDISSVNLLLDSAYYDCIDNSGGNYICNATVLGAGNYSAKIIAEDAGGLMGESQTFTVEVADVFSCYTATNQEHINEGRASLRYNVLVYANGSNDYLGQAGDTSSIEEASPNVWSKVESCPENNQQAISNVLIDIPSIVF